MGWATDLIHRLREGETVTFQPRGNSMTPRIRSGQRCTVRPLVDGEPLSKGDIVLCTVRGRQYLHLISGLRPAQVQISNNHGYVNGWCNRYNVHGKLTENPDEQEQKEETRQA